MKFSIDYVVDADNLEQATKIAHTNIYIAELDVDSVSIHALEPGENKYRTFDDPRSIKIVEKDDYFKVPRPPAVPPRPEPKVRISQG